MLNKLLKFAKTHWGFLISFLVVIVLMWIRFGKGEVQQDNYLGYAQGLSGKLAGLSYVDSRLFPGLPIFIFLGKQIFGSYIFAGYLLAFLFFVGSLVLLFKLTKSPYSFIPLIFPPAMLNSASLIAAEYPVIFGLLLAVYLIKKKNYSLSFLLIGISLWFKLVGIVPIAGILIYFLLERRLRDFFVSLPYLLIPVALFAVYNIVLFGNILHPIISYIDVGKFYFGFIQIFEDIPRAYAWGWYGILVSGLAHLVLYLSLMIYSAKTVRKGSFELLPFLIIAAVSVYNFVWTFNPFLENFGRYLTPVFPLFWLLLYKRFKSRLLAIILLFISVGVVLA